MNLGVLWGGVPCVYHLQISFVPSSHPNKVTSYFLSINTYLVQNEWAYLSTCHIKYISSLQFD